MLILNSPNNHDQCIIFHLKTLQHDLRILIPYIVLYDFMQLHIKSLMMNACHTAKSEADLKYFEQFYSASDMQGYSIIITFNYCDYNTCFIHQTSI